MEPMTETLPLVALRGLIVVPNMIINFDLNRDMSKRAVRQALNEEQKVLLVPQRDPEQETVDLDALYTVGTIANIRQVIKLPDNIDRVMVEGISRARLLEIHDHEGAYLDAVYEEIDETADQLEPTEEEALVRTLEEVFDTYVKFYPKIGKTVGKYFKEGSGLTMLIEQILINTPFTYDQKQKILEIQDISGQCEELVTLVMNEAQIAAIRIEN